MTPYSIGCPAVPAGRRNDDLLRTPPNSLLDWRIGILSSSSIGAQPVRNCSTAIAAIAATLSTTQRTTSSRSWRVLIPSPGGKCDPGPRREADQQTVGVPALVPRDSVAVHRHVRQQPGGPHAGQHQSQRDARPRTGRGARGRPDQPHSDESQTGEEGGRSEPAECDEHVPARNEHDEPDRHPQHSRGGLVPPTPRFDGRPLRDPRLAAWCRSRDG